MTSKRKAESILCDLVYMKIEGDISAISRKQSLITQEATGRNSHSYRTDRPLISTVKNYSTFLFDLDKQLRKELSKRQYIAVLCYFSHARVTLTEVSREMGYCAKSVSKAVNKALKIVSNERG